MNAATQRVDSARLGWTIACLVAAAAPHLANLPPWPMALMLLTILWRIAAQRGHRQLPGVVIRLLLALAGFAGVFVSFGTITGLDAGSTLLVVMAALKLTETRSVRDLIVLLLISYFLIVTQFLFGQSILVALYSIPAIWIITTALLQVSSPAVAMPWRRAFSRSGLLLAHAVPLMLIAFVLFPRMSGPFWAVPRSDNSAVTGLSDQMDPGSISRLLESDAVAFRAVFDDTPPPASQRYWRGPVLSNFDGRRWSIFQENDRELLPDSVSRAGDPVNYEITLEPHHRNWLFALELPNPAQLPRKTTMTADRRLLRSDPVTHLYQYRLESWPENIADASARRWTLSRDLNFPAERNPRAQALVRGWAESASDPADVVRQALQLFREQPFHYTRAPRPLDQRHPVDDFLFSSRRGFCEHYASAFTLMMRAAGIPARVVLGYQGGELNPFGRHMTVRQSDAHAWSEVWLLGRGWVRVDPTAAVAPERVELGVAGALPAGEGLGLFRSSAWLRQVQFGWDALNNGWNQWVLGFAREEQRTLLRALGMKRPTVRKMLLTLIGLATVTLSALAGWLMLQSRPAAPDPLAILYRRFCRKVSTIAGPRKPGEGPLDFAERVATARPAIATEVHAITRQYLAARYFPDPPERCVAELRRQVGALRT